MSIRYNKLFVDGNKVLALEELNSTDSDEGNNRGRSQEEDSPGRRKESTGNGRLNLRLSSLDRYVKEQADNENRGQSLTSQVKEKSTIRYGKRSDRKRNECVKKKSQNHRS